MGLSVHQTGRRLLREAIRGVLLAAIARGRDGDGGIGSVQCRASAALYALLSDHPIDRRGRCRCYRGPRVLLGHGRRVCRVLVAARFYLHQPDDVLLRRLASELGEPTPASRSGADSIYPHTPPTPAFSPPPVPGGSPRAGRPDPDHGGVGEPSPRRPRPRRAPLDDRTRPPGIDNPLVATGGVR